MRSNYDHSSFPRTTAEFTHVNLNECTVLLKLMTPEQMRERGYSSYTDGTFLFDYLHPHKLEQRAPLETNSLIDVTLCNPPTVPMSRAEVQHVADTFDTSLDRALVMNILFDKFFSKPHARRYSFRVIEDHVDGSVSYTRAVPGVSSRRTGVVVLRLVDGTAPLMFLSRMYPIVTLMRDVHIRLALLRIRNSQRKEDDDVVEL